MTTNKLTQLKKYTTVVADSGDLKAISQFKPQDCTTNPSLILQAASKQEYQYLVDEGISWAQNNHSEFNIDIVDLACEKIATNFVAELTKIVPGRVSLEVNARYSFDTKKTITTTRRLISILKDMNVESNRILIKIAATWEGIQACKVLETEGINCNMTLLFSKAQAISCAEAKAYLISPFVGRILDWYKKTYAKDYAPQEDPGVLSVIDIYNYYKKFDYKTIIMGASFRNIQEIEQLCGIDYLTISPQLLQELQNNTQILEPKLTLENAKKSPETKIELNEAAFRWMHNNDAMAVEKLAEGIRNFTKDLNTLNSIIKEKLNQP